MSQEPEQLRKIFVGGLNYKTTEEGLRAYYGQWGEVCDCVVMTDRESGKSRGFGFVTYTQSPMVDDAMNNRPHTIDGRQVQPKRAVARDQAHSPGANSSVTKIFVGGLRDKPVTKEDLEEYFGVFGEIKECMMITDRETGKPRGFAFVQFDDHDPVDKITMRKFHSIGGVNIEVRKAIPKDYVPAPVRGSSSRGGGFSTRGGYGGGDGSGSGGGFGFGGGQGDGFPRGGGGYGGGYGGRGGRGGYGDYREGGGPPPQGRYGGGGGGGGGPQGPSSPYGTYGGSPNMGFQAYGENTPPARQQNRQNYTDVGQTNTAYGFGSWGSNAGANRGGKDAAPSPTNTVAYQHLGQNYGQTGGGGPMAANRGGGGGGGPNRSAGVIGAGRPKPYSAGDGWNRHN